MHDLGDHARWDTEATTRQLIGIDNAMGERSARCR